MIPEYKILGESQEQADGEGEGKLGREKGGGKEVLV